ncbi:TRAP transporter substrate-binding protein [Chromohalobacter sp. 48-RD10]|uniref:TRAP transporter substrate-binding protein n=1 Tax=Chromohalobacter sp. 48-RD10 TaxID=2994063 RepID=UPI002468246C|nr:TRAP transporter substrate-binding protein [Chromohalobacter sp. 48-RD10]
MTTRRELCAWGAGSLLLAGLGIRGAVAADTRTLRLSHNLTTAHPVHRAMQQMAERVLALTDDTLKIEIYPNAQLGNQRESVELVQAGILDMAKTNASELEAFDPVFSLLNVPYLFESDEHYDRILEGEIGRDILAASAGRGFRGVTYYDSGARSFYATRPIESPTDLRNAKIRVQPSPTAIEMVELMGASPTPLAFGDLYTALQQGVVDGAENNPTALVTARHGEVAKYFTLDEHTRIPDMLVISEASWQGLSEAHQDALTRAAAESTSTQKAAWQRASEDAVATAKNEMGVEFIEVDKRAFAERTRPIRDRVAAQSPRARQWIEEIEAQA